MKFEVPDGATPIEDDEGLIAEVKTMADLNVAEAVNILEAAGRHLDRRKSADAAWLDEAYLRRLHRDMFDRVWEWAGRYRVREVGIGVAPEQVPEEIAKLLGDFRYWHADPAAGMPVLERAVRPHHRLVKIHPFRNGNGRHARMVSDVYLFSQKHDLPAWEKESSGAEGAARAGYIAGLRAADQGDYDPLTAFIRSLLPGERG